MGRGFKGHRRSHVGDTEDHPQVHALYTSETAMHSHLSICFVRDLAEHKLIFKSKMGKTVDGDMIRFQVYQNYAHR